MTKDINKYLNKVVCGDCYKLIKEIPDKSIDLIYTDFPYFFNYNKEQQTFRGTFKDIADKLQPMINDIDYSILDEFIRVLKHIYIYIWCSEKQIFKIANYFISKGFNPKILVWCKTNSVRMNRKQFITDCEYCICIQETQGNDIGHQPSKFYISALNSADKKRYLHPTVKPLDLVKEHISFLIKGDGIVLDPFMGSGTTAVACKQLGLKYIGFEINQEYVDIANDRLNDITQLDDKRQLKLF